MRLVNATETPHQASGTTYAVTLGAHATGDCLLCAVTQDTGTTNISFGNSTVTLTAAADTLTYSGSDIWANGDQIELTTSNNLTGTGLAVLTRYWIRDIDTTANTFKVAASAGGAAINITGVGTGTHTAHLMVDDSTGWAMIGFQAASQGARMAFAYKFATSGAETNPTFTGLSDDWIGSCLVYRDVDSIEGWMRSDWGNSSNISTAASNSIAASSAGGTTVITPSADALLVYGWCTDGANTYLRTKLSDSIAQSKRGYGPAEGVSHIVAHRQLSSAAVPNITAYCSASNEGGNGWVISLKPTANTGLQKQARVTATENSGIANWMGGFGATHAAITWARPSTFVLSAGGVCTFTINGTAITVSDGAIGTVTTNGTMADSPWGTRTTIPSPTTDETRIIGGNWVLPGSENLSGKIIAFTYTSDNQSADNRTGVEGLLCGFASADNTFSIYQLRTKAQGWSASQGLFAAIDLGNSTAIAIGSSGACDLAAVTRFFIGSHRAASSTGVISTIIKDMVVLTRADITGGGDDDPADFSVLSEDLFSWGNYKLADRQGLSQIVGKFPIRIGDGSNATYFASAPAFEFPRGFSATSKEWNVNASRVSVDVYAKSGDTIDLSAGYIGSELLQAFTINASSDTGATYSFAGRSFIGMAVTWKTGIPCANATFKQCTIDFKGAAPDTIFINTPDASVSSSTGACCSFDTNTTITNPTIDCVKEDGTNAGYFVSFGASVTAVTINNPTLTGTPGSTGNKKFYSAKTTGTLAVTWDGQGTSFDETDFTTAGASVTVTAPTVERGLEFTGLVAGSQVKVFTTGTDTELFSDNNSSTTETFDDATSGTITVDYVIQKAAYLPIRVTGVSLTGAVGTGVQAVSVQQQPARWYAASAGLTINTNCYANATTKLWGLTTTSTLQNLASYLLEQWIALGGTGGAFANKAFPIEANGPNSFTWLDGWEADTGTYAASISNLSRDGMRYKSAAGAVTAVWAAILTSGVPSGARVRYQQSDGGTTVDAAVSSGNMDELVKIYGDATHGNFDKTGYLVLKVQEMGYDQAEANAVTLYGTLEDQLYVVGLAPTANGVATGNPSLSTAPAITTGSFSHFGKTFGIKITDGATPNTGEGILRWLRYNFETGGAFQSRDAFDWHDLVQVNGTDYKTVRGNIYGTAAVKGVVVLMADGVTIHPDFNLLTADDGTTYSQPVTADISITGMPTAAAATTRLQIINQTALSAASWQAATAYAAGDLVLRTAGIGTESTAGLYMRCTTAGTSHATTEPTWDTTVGNTTTDGTVTWTTYAVLFYDADPVTASLTDTYIDGEEFLAGETVELRFAEMDEGTTFKRYHTTATVSSAGFSITVNEEADTVYAGYALDGSDFDTTFSPDYVATYLVLDTNTDFSGKSSYSYYCYLLTTSQGMYLFWDGYTALDAGNLRIETDVLDMYFDESNGFVKQTDDVRIFRSDGLRPALDPTTGGSGIEINWRTPVSVVIVSTSDAVISGTAEEIIAAIPSAATIANEVVNVVTF